MVKFEGIYASVIGSSHKNRGEEKQDSVKIRKDKYGNIAFCLSDGAGSSAHSKNSSELTAEFISSALIDLPVEIQKRGVGAWINDYIVQAVINLRSEFFNKFKTYDLREYHCTLVSGIIFDGNCLLAHLGDGAILAGTSLIENAGYTWNETLVLSEPENGEYKNETFFVTEPHWLSHLRIKFVPEIDWIIAGTDGGIDLLSRGDRIKDDYVEGILETSISTPPEQRASVLNDLLASSQADEITNDDKSLAIIFSDELLGSHDQFWDANGDTFDKYYPQIVETANELTEATSTSSQETLVQLLKEKKTQLIEFAQLAVSQASRRPGITSILSVFTIIVVYMAVFWSAATPQMDSSAEISETSGNQVSSEVDASQSKLKTEASSDDEIYPIGDDQSADKVIVVDKLAKETDLHSIVDAETEMVIEEAPPAVVKEATFNATSKPLESVDGTELSSTTDEVNSGLQERALEAGKPVSDIVEPPSPAKSDDDYHGNDNTGEKHIDKSSD